MNIPIHTLLRRTAMASVAVVSILLNTIPQANAAAGTVSLSNGQGCSYSNVVLGPDGGITVTCSAGNTGGGVGTVSLGAAPASIGMLSKLYVPITRSGGTDEATVHISIAGGCGPLETDYDLPANTNTANALVRMPGNPTTCTVSLTGVTDITTVSGSAIIGNRTVSIVVSATGTTADCTADPTQTACTPTTTGGNTGGNTGGTGSTSNCPAIGDAKAMTLYMQGGGTNFYTLASGQVGYMQLPALDPAMASSYVAQFNDSPVSPPSAVREISISRCPGVIDNTGSVGGGFSNPSGGAMINSCYATDVARAGAPILLNWYPAPGSNPTHTDQIAALPQYHVCEAYNSFNNSSNGPLYVNFRWTYSGSCGTPNGQCGYTGQFNVGFAPNP